ncbi:NAD(P)/FAD-dependent oxidoreductase [Rhizosphaericola mali]|uniref:NAD(P)/FAD-dependent oxidoreductase n=1 Tax=Rhizosphaericola mali TaxID=2545455 RepID=A0A5P2G242_9BACT|nr:NAD(P)/FAD-dependent oxidoreductase [Rhizosphaericola mali]QES87163.1 NAD(P)/FAD-dependent oxidoreductase [Rhizosphaericola mali]
MPDLKLVDSTINTNSTEYSTLQEWLYRFETALKDRNIDAVLNLFLTDCYWRDLASFTWNLYTSEGKEQIQEMLTHQLDFTDPDNWKIIEEVTENNGVIEGWFTFETRQGRGKGHIRLKDGLCWTLLTTLQELKGFEEKKGRNRERGAEHGVQKNRKYWSELKKERQETLGYTEQPYCVVIGGGQGGIGLGARLKKMGVPTIILDKFPRPGDQWRSRYKSLCLHDPVWYDHLPYLQFPEDWPVFCPKDKVGDWLEAYTKIMDLDYWSSSECVKASYDAEAKEWNVIVNKEGQSIILKPKQVIFALGVSGFPNIPKIAGAETFEGLQHHSSKHPGGDIFKGKKVAVIGANNSAHDICADLWENGADVTMIQRSSTHIIQSETLMDLVFGPLYSEDAVANGINVDKADLIFASQPFKIMNQFHIPIYNEVKKRDKAFYDSLEKAGFMLDFGDDGSGLFLKYLRRSSGYYINVGAAELVADGSIKLKSGVEIDQIVKDGILMCDGTKIDADVIVYATGYGSMNQWVAQIISQDVADQVGKCWGLGSNTTKDPGPWEGELRNMWKPTAHENLWFHGGNLHQSRHYSKYLALQIKARYEGLDVPVFGKAEVHHLK